MTPTADRDPGGERPETAACRGLRFTYAGSTRPALDGVDLQVRGNRRIGIVGPGGAGKSTLLRCFNRLVPEFFRGDLEGEIRVLGEPIRDQRVHEMARRVGMVFQDFESQLFSTTVELEVGFAAEQIGLPRAEIRERVDRYLAWTGLGAYRERDPARLSGGEKQKLAIASVLVAEPHLLLLDEPTTDLDPTGRDQVLDLMRRLGGSGSAVLIAEHETEELQACDEVVVLSGGKVVLSGTPEAVLTRVEDLDHHGIPVPALARVARRLTGEPALPADATECHRLLWARGVALREDRYRERVAGEDARARGYGAELLRVEAVHFRYPDGMEALRGVGLRVQEGEFVAILGGNGSGKTTLAMHLIGLHQPQQGAVYWKGTDLRRFRASEMGRRVGFVFQNPDHQIFSGTVREEVAFAARNLGLPPHEIESRAAEALATVGLAGREDADPFLLSKGDRQRLAVASVLAARPPVLVLDEPTTGLDQAAQRSMMDLLEGLNRRGHTLIIITHALALAARYAHRCVLLAGGAVVADGPAREVFADSERLGAAGLRQPSIVALGARFGRPVLSEEEFLHFCGPAPE